MSYVDIEVPEALQTKILDFLKKVTQNDGRIKKGMNETTKAIERKKAVFVVIAEDVSPPEIVMHIPKVAQEQKVPYGFVKSKAELGKSIGIGVKCSAVAVLKVPKEAQADLDSIVNDLSKLKD